MGRRSYCSVDTKKEDGSLLDAEGSLAGSVLVETVLFWTEFVARFKSVSLPCEKAILSVLISGAEYLYMKWKYCTVVPFSVGQSVMSDLPNKLFQTAAKAKIPVHPVRDPNPWSP